MSRDRSKLLIVSLLVFGVLALTCLVMSIVFAYDIALIYPNVIVNVLVTNSSTSRTQFYMRCDQTNNKVALENLLSSCGTENFNIQPGCNFLYYYSYYYGTYGFGDMHCPTGYLNQFTNTVNMNVNLVIVASIMMILGMILFCLPFAFVYYCVFNK